MGKERNMSRWKKLMGTIVKGSFLATIILILLTGLVSTLFFPDEILPDENRYANKAPAISMEAYMEGSFQTGLDTALGDQVNLASYFKHLYNRADSRFLNAVLAPLIDSGALDGSYIELEDICIFGDGYLVNKPYGEEKYPLLEKRAQEIADAAAAMPEVPLYVYYIERDRDTDFQTGKSAGLRETLFSSLQISEERMAYLKIADFNTYRELFYRTDHHWNYRGADQGCREILCLLDCEEPMLEPQETVTMDGVFAGWNAVGPVSNYRETFVAYRYAYPPMTVTINGQPAEDYGAQQHYLDTRQPVNGYGFYYGADEGEIIFDTGIPERENLLVLGESYDNAILKLLASRYNKTYSVDLRHYERLMGMKFDMAAYVKEKQIDRVLLVGAVDFYSSPEFALSK